MVSWTYWKLFFNIFHILEIQVAGGWLQGLCEVASDYFWNVFLGISGQSGNIGNMRKTGAEVHRIHRSMGHPI